MWNLWPFSQKFRSWRWLLWPYNDENYIFKKTILYSISLKKNLMLSYDVHKTIKLNCKKHDLRVWGSGFRAGPTLPYSENVFNLRKSSCLLHYKFEKNFMLDYNVHKSLYLNCEINVPWIRGWGPKAGQTWSYSKNLFNIRKFTYLLPQQKETNWIHSYGVYEALYLNCEISDPLRRANTATLLKCIICFIFSSLLSQFWEENYLTAMMDIGRKTLFIIDNVYKKYSCTPFWMPW